MKISELIDKLEEARTRDGDLPVYSLGDWEWELTEVSFETKPLIGYGSQDEALPPRILLR